MSNAELGVIGMGTMGRNLALNVAEKGFPVAVWNRSPGPAEQAVAEARAQGLPLSACATLAEFAAALRPPRRVLILVKAGKPVDDTIEALCPALREGDIVIDGGNEWWENTERRGGALAAVGLRMVGMGVSGGEQGARHGPSLMPGGPREAWDALAPVLKKVAAQVEDGPCTAWIGPGGSGHFVKMVHNGIEYGDMQIIAEAYDLLRSIGGLSNDEVADTFAAWNEGELQSFLIEITARVFRQRDPETGGRLIDAIRDEAAMKGTGTWTVQEAARLGVAAPTMAAAVDGRMISSDRAGRDAARRLAGPAPAPGDVDKRALVSDVRDAMYAAKICSYAQGMQLLRAASQARGWDLPLGEIARIWKGGCIIRARFLGRIQQAFARDSALPNLAVDPSFREDLAGRQDAWRRVAGLAVRAGVPAPATAASLAWYDAIRRERLPANLIQAQRDLFGAHSYRRTDRDGVFHTEWD